MTTPAPEELARDKLREALSIALQYVPLESKDPHKQAEIDAIARLAREADRLSTPQSPAVTEEMVERAAETYWNSEGRGFCKWADWTDTITADRVRKRIRAALTAALSRTPEGKS